MPSFPVNPGSFARLGETGWLKILREKNLCVFVAWWLKQLRCKTGRRMKMEYIGAALIAGI